MRLLSCLLISCSISLLTYSCQTEQPNNQIHRGLPPEKVLEMYQKHYDNNEFEKAKAFSTIAEQQRLDELAGIIAMEIVDSTILETTFLSIDCKTQKDTAICICNMQDQYEQYEADYQLVRQGAFWLVDAPHEEHLRIDEELDRLMDSLLNTPR